MREPREPRSEPCVCGGIITTSSKAGIRLVVRAHNGSLLHRRWRLGQQVRDLLEEEHRRIEGFNPDGIERSGCICGEIPCAVLGRLEREEIGDERVRPLESPGPGDHGRLDPPGPPDPGAGVRSGSGSVPWLT